MVDMYLIVQMQPTSIALADVKPAGGSAPDAGEYST
jgi:hypothetical protein